MTRPRNRRVNGRQRTPSLLAIPVFLAAVTAAYALWHPPYWFALVYAVGSLFTFIAYALDKSSAERGLRRTPEKTLHTLALAGGWPGALLAQRLLRHKSSKAQFQAVFWATVALNIAGFIALCSPFGRPLWAA